MKTSTSQSNKAPLNYGSPCAACKFLRKKCPPRCIFSPHFPQHQPRKFEVVHRIYGASNISKILNQLSYDQRNEAVASLLYEAECRMNEPIRGCTGFLSILQVKLAKLQIEILAAQQELSNYMELKPQAYMPFDGLSSSGATTTTQPKMATTPSLNEQFRNDSGESIDTPFRYRTEDMIQQHLVDNKSDVCLLEQHSFGSQQQQTIVEQKPPMIIHYRPTK